MSSKTQKILIITAVLLLVLAMVGIVAVILMDRAPGSEDSTSGDTTEAAVIHEPEEYVYDEDGKLSCIKYYKDNVYDGQKDFFVDNKTGTEYTMLYDAENNEIESEKTERNTVGSVKFYQKRVLGVVVQTVEYDYYDNMKTLKKRTTKDFDSDGNENAEKLYYYENGKVSRRCEYLNGELERQEFYDEEGNTIDAPEEGS